MSKVDRSDESNFEASVCKDYRSGVSVNRISRKYGIGVNRIYEVLDSNQIPRKTNNGKAPTIVSRYLGGATMEQIADDMHISVNVVKHAISKAGLPSRPKGPSPASTHVAEEMAALYNQGMTMEQIGQKYQVTRQYVQLLIKGIVNTKQVRAKRHEAKLKAIASTVINDYASPMALSELYKKHKIRVADLEHILSAHNVPRRQATVITDQSIQWIIEQYKKGFGYSAIAKKLGTHPLTAKKILESHGVEIRRPGRVSRQS